MDLSYEKVRKLLHTNSAVVTWSGGLDTTALVALAIEELELLAYPLFVNRFQENYTNEKKSIEYFSALFSEKYKSKFNEPLEVVAHTPPLEFKKLFPETQVEKTYALRNSDIVNQAVRYALIKDVKTVLVGSNRDDQFADNSYHYWLKKTEEVREGTKVRDLQIVAPFQELDWTKKDIVSWCYSHAIPIHLSWSCWRSGEEHCGVCSPCVRRKEAFKLAIVHDMTAYRK